MRHLTSNYSRQLDIDDLRGELDRILSFALSSARDIEAKADEILNNLEPASDEEVAAFRDYILTKGRTPEWNIVIARIEKGELTWREIVDGDCERDSDVLDAMRSTPRMSLQATAEPTEYDTGANPNRETGHPRSHYHNDDDDYFEGLSVRA